MISRLGELGLGTRTTGRALRIHSPTNGLRTCPGFHQTFTPILVPQHLHGLRRFGRKAKWLIAIDRCCEGWFGHFMWNLTQFSVFPLRKLFFAFWGPKSTYNGFPLSLSLCNFPPLIDQLINLGSASQWNHKQFYQHNFKHRWKTYKMLTILWCSKDKVKPPVVLSLLLSQIGLSCFIFYMITFPIL